MDGRRRPGARGVVCLLVAVAAVGIVPARAPARPRETPVAPAALPYAGLGAWIDVYDAALWRDPAATVRGLARRRVDTLFLETSSYRQRADVVRPAAARAFVEAAHAAGIDVVAWYLPSLANLRRDLRRSLAALRLSAPAGDGFDSFALDIEAPVVRSPARRTRAVLSLARRIRIAAGPRYALGAIIPSPVGMERAPSYWPGFPYRALRRSFDAFLPMAYFAWRVSGERAAYAYTLRCVTAIRTTTGDGAVPVHPIGGVADAIDAREARGFARAARDGAAVGASLYDAATSDREDWRPLAALAR